MHRFKKKVALACTSASLIVACCLCANVGVAFAQSSPEASWSEACVDSLSLVDDESQSDTPSVIRDGWQLDESTGSWYYGNNGKHQTGWVKSGGYWYWLDPANDGAMQAGFFSVTDAAGSTFSFYANDHSTSMPYGAICENGWVLSSEGKWFYAKVGGYLASGWLFQNGTWYYLDPVTYAVQTGFTTVGGERYFLDSSGAMRTGWIYVDGEWYWSAPSGALVSSWRSIGGVWYYFDPQTLAMFKGRRKIEGTTYIFNDYGLANGWALDGSDWYLCTNGVAETGWRYVNGSWYYLDPAFDGKMAVGYLKIGSAAYYLKPYGAMAVGWTHSHNGWYLASASGALCTGWCQEGSSWYFLNLDSNLMETGLFEAYGNDCFASQSGRLVVSDWVTTENGVERYADSNGFLCKDVVRENGTTLKSFADGEWQLAAGWVDVADHWFYAEPGTGLIQHGWLQVGDDWYWLDPNSGEMKTGWLFTSGSWFYLNSDGKMATGWKYVGGKWYFLDQNGHMHVGWLKDSGKWYWMDGSGAMATGARTIDGIRRMFWSDGQCDKVGWQNPPQYPQVSSWTVQLPSYCTGYFTYVTPSRISVEATREDCVDAFIQRAYEYIGTQYIEPWSTAPGGAVDCSGFVLQCLYATGMDMGIYNPYNHRWDPSQTYNSMNWYHSNIFMPVSTSSIQRGDVIYYRGHIAIALGNGMMIDSWPHQGVGIHPISARGNVIGAARPFV